MNLDSCGVLGHFVHPVWYRSRIWVLLCLPISQSLLLLWHLVWPAHPGSQIPQWLIPCWVKIQPLARHSLSSLFCLLNSLWHRSPSTLCMGSPVTVTGAILSCSAGASHWGGYFIGAWALWPQKSWLPLSFPTLSLAFINGPSMDHWDFHVPVPSCLRLQCTCPHWKLLQHLCLSFGCGALQAGQHTRSRGVPEAAPPTPASSALSLR